METRHGVWTGGSLEAGQLTMNVGDSCLRGLTADVGAPEALLVHALWHGSGTPERGTGLPAVLPLSTAVFMKRHDQNTISRARVLQSAIWPGMPAPQLIRVDNVKNRAEFMKQDGSEQLPDLDLHRSIPKWCGMSK